MMTSPWGPAALNDHLQVHRGSGMPGAGVTLLPPVQPSLMQPLMQPLPDWIHMPMQNWPPALGQMPMQQQQPQQQQQQQQRQWRS